MKVNWEGACGPWNELAAAQTGAQLKIKQIVRHSEGSKLGFVVLNVLRSYLSTAALGLLIVYFAYHALTGEQGLLTSAQRDATLVAKSAELANLVQTRQDLEVRAQLLRDNSLSADLLEERARSLLGYSDPRDYVIRIQHGDSSGG